MHGLRAVVGCQAFISRPNIWTQFGQRHVAAALDVQLTDKRAVKALALAQGLTQVADGSSGATGVVRLVCRAQGREVAAEGVHA